MKFLLVLTISLGATAAFALTPAPQVPKNPLTSRPNPLPAITCENLETELANLKTMTSESNSTLAAFMDEVVSTIGKWYNQLVQLEEKPLPKGSAAPIDGAVKSITEVQSMAWENMAILDARFDQVLEVLSSCLKPAPTVTNKP